MRREGLRQETMHVDVEKNAEDIARVCSYFKRSISSYEKNASVQKCVGRGLIDRLNTYSDLKLNRVFEVGCYTGSTTTMLCESLAIQQLWVNDLVKECCIMTAERVAGKVQVVNTLPGDIESVTLPEALDLIVSSSTYQWLKDLPGCFRRLAEKLSEGGYFAFSMFGPGTMGQVQQLTGVGLHYLDENRIRDIVNQLFNIEFIATSHHRIFLASPREVLRHIQCTGVGGICGFRWTPSKLKSFEAEYYSRFGCSEGVPVDYVATTVIARKYL